MRRLLPLVPLLLVGCAKSSPTAASDVDLTIVAPTDWSTAQLAKVTSLSVAVSGAQASLVGMSYKLTRPMLADEMIVVHLKAGSPPVQLSAVAKAGDTVVGVGSTTVMLKAPGPTAAILKLGNAVADGFLPGDAGSAVALQLPALSMLSNQSAQLHALGPVTWSIAEGATGGSVDANGLYTAPATAGTYHATATSTLYYQESAAATITVYDKGITPYVGGFGGIGYEDGVGSAARLEHPAGAVSDGTYVYLTAPGNRVVRRFDPATNTVSTWAGSSASFVNSDGTLPNVGILYPAGIVTDGNGTFYLANNTRIRKVSGGTMTTLVGNAGYGHVDGPPATAQLEGMGALAYDGTSALYVFEYGSCSLRRIDLPSGNVTTVAGPPSGDTSGGCNNTFTAGTGTAARFCGISYLTIINGVIYALDTCPGANSTVRRYAIANGNVDTLTTSSPGFWSITQQGNTLWAFDTNQQLGKIDLASGAYTAVTALPQGGGYGAFLGSKLYYIGFAGVLDSVDTATMTVTAALAGQPARVGALGPINWVLGYKRATQAPDGTLYLGVGDWNRTYPFVRIDRAKGSFTQLKATNLPMGSFADQLTTDGTRLYFNDGTSGIDSAPVAGGAITTVATLPAGSNPHSLTVDGKGNLFLAETQFNVAQIKLSDGTITNIAGTTSVGGGTDGTGAAAQFTTLNGLVSDGNGMLYATDGAAIRSITVPGGVVTTIAGDYQYVNGNCVDDVGKKARFADPQGITIDSTKTYLYVSDRSCATIRRVTIADGTVTTVVGATGRNFIMPGALPGAISSPGDLFFTPAGDLTATLPNDNGAIAQIRF